MNLLDWRLVRRARLDQMESCRKAIRSSWVRRASSAAAVAGVATLVALIFPPWPSLNSLCEDVDIKSGRIRRSHYLLGIQISSTIEESWLSQLLTVKPPVAEWRRVNTFSPSWVHVSPHHVFHGAIAQIELIEVIDRLLPMTPDAREAVAKRVIADWDAGSYFRAGDFIHALSIASDELRRSGASALTIDDVPR